MKITVIVPVYNKSKAFINECIDSLNNQTLRKEYFNVTIIDDSSDLKETKDALEKIKESNKHIKILKNKKNMGLNKTRQIGIEASSNEYIFFIDADDILTRDALETLWIKASETKSDIVTSLMYRYNGTSISYNTTNRLYITLPDNNIERLKIFLSGESSFSMCGKLLKRSILTNDIFKTEPDKILHEDLTTSARILFKNPTISNTNKHLYYYRWNPGSITSSVSEEHIDGIFYAFNDWIAQARKLSLDKELSPYIIYGISTLSNLWILRALFKPNINTKPLNILKKIHAELTNKNITPIIGNHKGLKILKEMEFAKNFSEQYLNTLKIKYKLEEPVIKYNEDSKLDIHLKPSYLAQELNNKIVFICQVDYHVKTATYYIKNLRDKYNNLVILDNSSLAEKGSRCSSNNVISELKQSEHIRTTKLPLYPDSLCTAQLVITFNDFNSGIRDALEFRYLHKKPTACIIEGVNDFLRLDFETPVPHSYRSCETVLLSGNNDKQYFKDRETFLIGLPIVETLANKQSKQNKTKLAVVNSNFAYGSLEEKRNEFITSIKEVIAELNWDWVITKHPADKGDFSGLPVSNKSMYELIDSCGVFISKFSTGIIEALASGKPVIYYNSHHEKNPKYKESLGAYYIANSKKELKQALLQTEKDILNGVDFRKRALPFLLEHTGFQGDDYSYKRLDKFIQKKITLNMLNL